MYFIVVGTLLLILKIASLGPVGNWSWWIILAPFGLAVIWWAWADQSGFTKRREMDRMEKKRQDRRIKNMENLGMDPKGRRRGSGH